MGVDGQGQRQKFVICQLGLAVCVNRGLTRPGGLSYHHVDRVIETASMMRRIISIIMQTRPATLDKRLRLTPPEATLQAGIKRNKRKKYTPPEFGSSEDVISRHVVELLGTQVVARAEANGIEWESPFGFREEVEVTVSSISSSGMSYFNVCVDPCLSTSVSFFVSCMVIDQGILEQAKDLPLSRRRSVHGSSSFRSRYPERSFAPASIGMQGCTPLQT
jgi:hypothetical protein